MEDDKYILPPEVESELTNFYHQAFDDESFDTPIYSDLKTIDSHFANKELYSSGGMKYIYLVDDRRTGRPIIMAELKKEGGCSHDEIEQFLREARITAALEHPNIVPIYDIGLNRSGRPYFTMKFLQGESLNKVIRELRKANPYYLEKYSLNMLLDIFLKVCEAVAFAHSNKIVHLDIKPDNVVIGSYGEVYLCDWGLAKLLDESDNELTRIVPLDEEVMNGITVNGVVKGTPGFMAPEQVDPKFGQKNEQTDIYAIGALLYSILCFRKPYHGLSANEIIHATVAHELASPDKMLSKEIPTSLSAVCMKALNKLQNERYGSVGNIINEVRAYQEGFATAAERVTLFKSLGLLFCRNKVFSIMVLLIVFTISTLSFIMMEREREALLELDKSSARYEETIKGLNSQLSEKVDIVEKLESSKREYRDSLILERVKLHDVLDRHTVTPNSSIVVNKLHYVVSPNCSMRVPLSNSPSGTTGNGLKMVDSDIFHTGINLPEVFTMSLWVKAPDSLQRESMKIFTDEGGNNEFNFRVSRYGAIKVTTYPGVNNTIDSAFDTVRLGEWNHFTVVHRGALKNIELYVNGKMVRSSVSTYSHSWGRLNLANFDCIIDELRIWRGAHNLETIMVNKNSLTPSPNGLVGWFQFDEEIKKTRVGRGKIVKTDPLVENRVKNYSKTVPISKPAGADGNGLHLLVDETLYTGITLPETFSIAFWVKTPAVFKKEFLNIFTDDGKDHELSFKLLSRGSVVLETFPNPQNQIVTNTGSVRPECWTHFTIVHRGEAKGLELYLDGKLERRVPTNFAIVWGKLKIANCGCVIDELRVWEKPLSSEMVLQNMTDLSPEVVDMLGWYNFNSDTNTVFRDSSGKGNDATTVLEAFK